jgi:hypothetical protein
MSAPVDVREEVLTGLVRTRAGKEVRMKSQSCNVKMVRKTTLDAVRRRKQELVELRALVPPDMKKLKRQIDLYSIDLTRLFRSQFNPEPEEAIWEMEMMEDPITNVREINKQFGELWNSIAWSNKEERFVVRLITREEGYKAASEPRRTKEKKSVKMGITPEQIAAAEARREAREGAEREKLRAERVLKDDRGHEFADEEVGDGTVRGDGCVSFAHLYPQPQFQPPQPSGIDWNWRNSIPDGAAGPYGLLDHGVVVFESGFDEEEEEDDEDDGTLAEARARRQEEARAVRAREKTVKRAARRERAKLWHAGGEEDGGD